jgi:hypothetical protein
LLKTDAVERATEATEVAWVKKTRTERGSHISPPTFKGLGFDGALPVCKTGLIEDLIDDIALLKDAVFVERFPRLLLLILFIANSDEN